MSVARRVDQLLSSLGYCARAEARAWCAAGRVTVSGAVVKDAASRVDPALTRVDGEALDAPELLVLLNKPLGVVCSHEEREGPSVYGLLPARWRRRTPVLTSVGRLDKDTSGLLLLTDVGALVQRLTSPKRHVAKVYRAELDGEPSEEAVAAFAKGLRLEGEEAPTLPATLTPCGDGVARVTLREGRYHQVRRMFAAVGLHVRALHREAFGPWTLGELPAGAWRALPMDEALRALESS